MVEEIRPGQARVVVNGLRFMGRHGVLPDEHVTEQPFVVDVELVVDEPGADELSCTVNYAELARIVSWEVGGEHVDLIETLAARIADACGELPGIHDLTICVHKPQAPIGFPVADVSATVVRHPGIEGGQA